MAFIPTLLAEGRVEGLALLGNVLVFVSEMRVLFIFGDCRRAHRRALIHLEVALRHGDGVVLARGGNAATRGRVLRGDCTHSVSVVAAGLREKRAETADDLRLGIR